MIERILLPGLVLLLLLEGADAQEGAPPAELATPRATMQTFLAAVENEDVDAALECLDTSFLGRGATRSQKVVLVFKLGRLLDATGPVRIADIPPRFSGAPFVHAELDSGRIAIAQSKPGGPWLFAGETLEALDGMLDEVAGRRGVELELGEEVPFSVSPALWLRGKMPPALRKQAFLIETWQWLALLALSLMGVVTGLVVSVLVPAIIRRQLGRRRLEVEPSTAKFGLRPLGLLAMALVWSNLVGWIGLPLKADQFLVGVARFVAAVAGVWALYRLVDLVSDVLTERARRTATRFDDLLIPLVRKSLKVFVTVAGLIFIASVLELKVTSLLAGLGLGGVAVALAARETVANLFGSVTIVLDRPFQVGDWVLIGEHEGSVEEVGFRATRIRTFYSSLITVPNQLMITAVVDNMGARRFRRIKTTIGVQYDTPAEKLEAFCEGIRELVRRHPYTRKDYYHVYVNAFGPHSLDILLYIFLETPEWATELRERHRLIVDIVRLARRLGVRFAFPTQTIHLAREGEGPPAEEIPLPVAAEVDRARADGRREARGIVRGSLGEDAAPPPPVDFGLPEEEMRGDPDDEEDGV